MKTIFFFIALLTARPGQVLEPMAGVQSNVTSTAGQFAEAERQLKIFRSRFAIVGSDGSPTSIARPNEKLMTLESVVTELELDALGKEALWRQLQQTSPEQMPVTPELRALLNTDPILLRLTQDLSSIEKELRLGREPGASPRDVSRMEQQYAVSKQRLDEETATKTLIFNQQQISQAEQSYLRSQDMLCRARDQLDRVKSEQRELDTRMAEYIRLIEARDTLRLKLAEEQEASELARLRGMSLDELKSTVQRTRATLEKARRAHQIAVDALNEAVARSNQAGAGEISTQPDSKPAGE